MNCSVILSTLRLGCELVPQFSLQSDCSHLARMRNVLCGGFTMFLCRTKCNVEMQGAFSVTCVVSGQKVVITC